MEIEALHEAMDELGGFIATYGAVAEGRSLDVTMAADFASATGLLRMRVDVGGEVTELRTWNDDTGKVHFRVNEAHRVFDGVFREMELTFGWVSRLAGTEEPAELFFLPSILLEPGGVAAGIQFGSRRMIGALGVLDEAEWVEADEELVVFRHETHGLLTISREVGLLTRQVVAGDDGGERVFELKHLEPNPGAGALVAMSADWHAEEVRQGHWADEVRRMRGLAVELPILAVVKGGLALVDLEERLVELRPELVEVMRAAMPGQVQVLRMGEDDRRDFVEGLLPRAAREIAGPGADWRNLPQEQRLQVRAHLMRWAEGWVRGNPAELEPVRMTALVEYLGAPVRAEGALAREAQRSVFEALGDAYVEAAMTWILDTGLRDLGY